MSIVSPPEGVTDRYARVWEKKKWLRHLLGRVPGASCLWMRARNGGKGLAFHFHTPGGFVEGSTYDDCSVRTFTVFPLHASMEKDVLLGIARVLQDAYDAALQREREEAAA